MEESESAPRAVSARRRVGMERCLLCLTLVLFSSGLGLVLALTQVVGDAEHPAQHPAQHPAPGPVGGNSSTNSSMPATGPVQVPDATGPVQVPEQAPGPVEVREASGLGKVPEAVPGPVEAPEAPLTRAAAASRSRRQADAAGLCTSEQCVEMAARLLRSRDPAADPCADFHQAACGRWLQEVRLLGLSNRETSYSASSDYVEASVDQRLLKLLEGSQSSVLGIAWVQYFYQHCLHEVHGTQAEVDEAADYILQRVLGGLVARRPPGLTSTLLRLDRLTAAVLVDVTPLRAADGGGSVALAIGPADDTDAGGGASHRPPWRRRRAMSVLGRSRMGRAAAEAGTAAAATGGGGAGRRSRRRPKSRRGRVQPKGTLTPPEPVTAGLLGDEYGDYSEYEYRIGDGTDGSEDGTGGDPALYGDGQREADEPQTPIHDAARNYEEMRNASLTEDLEAMSNYFVEEIVDKGLYPESFAQEDHDSMMEFMRELYKIIPTAREAAISEAQLHLQPTVTVEQLQNRYPYVEWKRYLSGVTQTAVKDSDPVYVPFPRYMEQLGKLLYRYHPRVVHNTLLLRFRTEFLADLADSLVRADASISEGRQFCLSLAKEAFPGAMSALFVRDVGKQKVEQLRLKVSSILEEIRAELLRSIDQKIADGEIQGSDPDPLLAIARGKISNVRTFLLSPERLWNDSYVNANTPAVTKLWRRSPQSFRVLVRPGRKILLDLLKGMRRADIIFLKSTLRELSNPDPTRWPVEMSNSFTANAFNLATRNAVGIPLALLTAPFFYEDVPEYVQFAGLGVVLAHELLHSIDSAGFSFDETGVARHLSAELQRHLTVQFRCVRTDYVQLLTRAANNAHGTDDVQLDGDLTLGENTADYSSLALTLAAYRRRRERIGAEPALPGLRMTERQTFFMAFAQMYCADIDSDTLSTLLATSTHPPGPDRLNRMVRHTAEFAAAFGCSADAPMSVQTRCEPVW